MWFAKKKMSISEVSEFSILPFSQIWKLGFKNLGKKIPSFRIGRYLRR